MYETQSFISFFVYLLKVSVISGNGGDHCKVLPRSPWVPIAHKYLHSDAMSLSRS